MSAHNQEARNDFARAEAQVAELRRGVRNRDHNREIEDVKRAFQAFPEKVSAEIAAVGERMKSLLDSVKKQLDNLKVVLRDFGNATLKNLNTAKSFIVSKAGEAHAHLSEKGKKALLATGDGFITAGNKLIEFRDKFEKIVKDNKVENLAVPIRAVMEVAGLIGRALSALGRALKNCVKENKAVPPGVAAVCEELKVVTNQVANNVAVLRRTQSSPDLRTGRNQPSLDRSKSQSFSHKGELEHKVRKEDQRSRSQSISGDEGWVQVNSPTPPNTPRKNKR